MSTFLVSMALGAVVAHTETAPVSSYAELRTERGHLSAHVAAIGGAPRIGLGLVANPSRFSFGLDVIYAANDEVVGTSLRYGLHTGVKLTDRYSLELRHESNCRTICADGTLLDFIPHGPENKQNAGYTGLVINYRF